MVHLPTVSYSMVACSARAAHLCISPCSMLALALYFTTSLRVTQGALGIPTNGGLTTFKFAITTSAGVSLTRGFVHG